MFIPLNISDTLKSDGWPDVLIAGDTASVFYTLSLVSGCNARIFLADTGIDGPGPMEFQSGRCYRSRDRADVYYDFFESPCKIGAGIVRRMDLVICTPSSHELADWAMLMEVPSICIKWDRDGVRLRYQGLDARPAKPPGSSSQIGSTISGLLAGAIGSPTAAGHTTDVFIDMDGAAHIRPPEQCARAKQIVPEETCFSAWDDTGDVLKQDDVLELPGMNEKRSALDGHDVKLIELGVPELHILKIKSSGPTRYVELTGDLCRVFDGLF